MQENSKINAKIWEAREYLITKKYNKNSRLKKGNSDIL
jgi:hypothetical protein